MGTNESLGQYGSLFMKQNIKHEIVKITISIPIKIYIKKEYICKHWEELILLFGQVRY